MISNSKSKSKEQSFVKKGKKPDAKSQSRKDREPLWPLAPRFFAGSW